MKRILNQLMMVAALMGGAMSVTSCLFGEVDNPVTPQITPEKTEAEIQVEKVKEVVALLEEAQETGSLTSMYYTIGDTDYEAVFKKEGEQFVLQELKSNKAATRSGEEWEIVLELASIKEGKALINEITPEDVARLADTNETHVTAGAIATVQDQGAIIDEQGSTWLLDETAINNQNIGAATDVDKEWSEEDEKDLQNPVDKSNAAADDEPAIAPSDQALHFMVKDKATDEVLIDSYTNLGNLETEQQTVDVAQVKDQITVNGKTKETYSYSYFCKISILNSYYKITYNKRNTTWAQMVDGHDRLVIKDKIVAYKSGSRYFWVIDDDEAEDYNKVIRQGNYIKHRKTYKTSPDVKGIRIYMDVDKNVYSTTWEKNQFWNGDKIQARLEFSGISKYGIMRDAFRAVPKGPVTVKKVKGKMNIFEITANEEPTGEKKVEEFEVTFYYQDYNNLEVSCTLQGGVNLYKDIDENTPPAAEIDSLYTKMDKEGWTITADYAEYPIGDFIGGFKIQTLTEPYAKALAEKISSENSLSGVAILMDGNTESGFDLYVLNGSSSGKVHLAADEKPTSLVGLTLFYIKKEDKE